MCSLNFTTDNWLTLISLIFVIIGGYFAVFQWITSNKIKCAFQNLIDYAIKNKLFPKDFMTNTSRNTKTLNW
jgi:hypothetical protein